MGVVSTRGFIRNGIKTNVGRNDVESIKWCGVVEVNEPTWRIIKVDIGEETRFGIQPQVSEPVGRGAKINSFHRFDLRVHDLLKTRRLASIIAAGWGMLDRFTWRNVTGGKGAVVLL